VVAEHLDEEAVHLAFERSGGYGDPVALIHGGWEDGRAWDLVVPGLAAALQVLVYDRRAHGESSGPPRGRPVRDDAFDLARLLESTELFPAHLVAHGYGGAVALRLAVDRPELVRSIALHEVPFVELLGAGAPGPAGGPSVEHRLRQARELALGGTTEVAACRYLGLFASSGEQWPELDERTRRSFLGNALAWAEEMGDPEAVRPLAEELRGIAVPVLATAGDLSPRFASQIHERLVAELPNATALSLRDTGHLVHRTDPDLLVGVLGSFLLERNVPTT
jgi:pimeloyl-ACP methyl ester carboxylesterase